MPTTPVNPDDALRKILGCEVLPPAKPAAPPPPPPPRAKPKPGKFSELCTPEELHQLLIYDPDTGTLTWRTRPMEWFKHCEYPKQVWTAWNSQNAGKPAMTSKGYRGARQGDINGHRYLAHMVIWAMKHGKWADVKHINGNRADNRIENLQEVVGATRDVAGVSWHKAYSRWYAVISVEGRQRHLGSFTDKDEAIAARRAAEKEYLA